MIRSMTGYGRSSLDNKVGKVTVEISSINRKYLETAFSVPKEMSFLEVKLKELTGRHLKRGRISVHVDFRPSEDNIEFYVDMDMARKFREALKVLSEELDLPGEITVRDLLAHKEILSFERTPLNVEKIVPIIERCVEDALEQLILMREREGQSLEQDIRMRLKILEVKVREIQSLAPVAVQRYEQKLKKKLLELLSEIDHHEDRIMKEVAIMAEKLDITEEVVRFVSHVEQFLNALDGSDSIGRLLDFLIQEMFREINTITSKSNELEISRLSVEIKNELDKIREQIQNVE